MKYSNLPFWIFYIILIVSLSVNLTLRFGWEIAVIHVLAQFLLFVGLDKYMDWAHKKDLEKEKRE
ncbi:MAG: hypothetical protein QXR76_03295 [Candidatus Bathyarchaeia archaeon]